MLALTTALVVSLLAAGSVTATQPPINSTSGVSWQCENYGASPTARYGGDCPVKDKSGKNALASFQYAAIHSAYGASFSLNCQYGKTQCAYSGSLDYLGPYTASPAVASCPDVTQRNASSVPSYPYPQAKFHCATSAQYPNGTVVGSSFERLNGTTQHTLVYQCDYSRSSLQLANRAESCVFGQDGKLKSGGKNCPSTACPGP